MVLGAKLLIGAVSLATASCGGYMVYKKAFSSSSEGTSPKVESTGEQKSSTDPKNLNTSPDASLTAPKPSNQG